MTRDPITDARAAAARGDYESAITLLRPLAEAGDRDAQYELGFLAMTECDLISGREAFSLLMKAAEQGHAEAMYYLAIFPEFASEPFKSLLSEEETWRWLLRAAESGSVQAQYDAGASLATGDWGEGRVPQDLEAAIAWYRRAADAGHTEAQYNLGIMLVEGEGCERDLAAANEWLRRAVAGGHKYAERLLSDLDWQPKTSPMLIDRHGHPVTVGTKVRLLQVPSGVLDDLPDDERAEVMSMVGEVFEVEDVYEGRAFICKNWPDTPETFRSHCLYLDPREMEVVE